MINTSTENYSKKKKKKKSYHREVKEEEKIEEVMWQLKITDFVLLKSTAYCQKLCY